MKELLAITAAAVATMNSYAQDSSPIKVSGYVETYYGYDFNKPADNNRPEFIYSHNRHNEVNLNLGFIKGSFDNGSIRANLAVMAGTYSNANLAAEPGVLKNIFEAYAGIKLSRTANLWLDAGIMPSHIGFESAISRDCWVLTRNIASENTPYYEAGAKLTYTSDDNRWLLSALYLNGWQRMNRQDGNSQPAGGLQVSFKPTDKITLNYSNYLGTERADSIRVRRFYNNFYGIFQLADEFGVTLGFDYGLQEKAKGAGDYHSVYSAVAIARYQFHPKFAIAGRAEYYHDENGIFISSGIPQGFKTAGYSLNVDYVPNPNAIVRLEGKVYHSPNRIFQRVGNQVNDNGAITASIAVAF